MVFVVCVVLFVASHVFCCRCGLLVVGCRLFVDGCCLFVRGWSVLGCWLLVVG